MNVIEVTQAINTLKKHLKISKIVLPQYKLDELNQKTEERKKNIGQPILGGLYSTNSMNVLGITLESK